MSTIAKPIGYGPSSAADPNQGRSFGGAFGVSAFAHGAAFALLVLLTLAMHDRSEEKPAVFELVAGEGDDFMATEAPSGSESGQAEAGQIEFAPTVQAPDWTPPAPEPVPVAPVAPPEPPTPVKPVVSEVKPAPAPDFTRQINRTIQREKSKADREIKKQRETEAREAKARELESKKLSYAEYQKSLGNKTSPAQKAPSSGVGAAVPRIDASGIKKGVAGATGAGSKGAGGTALSAAEGERMARYFAMLISRLRDAHEKPAGLSDLLNAEVQFTLAANGVISGVRIIRSSGNSEFDQSVVEAFSRVRMPARPDGKTDVQRLTFRIKEV